MTPITESESKLADVEVLSTTQDIEQKSNDYDKTEPGKMIVDVSVLRNETSLTKSQIAYRVQEGEDNRDFVDI